MTDWLHLPVVKAALAGLLSAASVDFVAFRSWKSINDAMTYNWGVALFRWGQGAAVGVLTNLGLGVV